MDEINIARFYLQYVGLIMKTHLVKEQLEQLQVNFILKEHSFLYSLIE